MTSARAVCAPALLLAALSAGTAAAAQEGTARSPATDTAVDLLLQAGRLQEAAWAARAAGDTARGDEILERLRDILEAPPLRAAPLGMDSQGVSYTFRVEHSDGVVSIFKVDGSDIFCRECGTDRELAAYAVDRLLGLDLTPMTVRTRIVDDGDTLSGSTMYFVHGASSPRDLDVAKPDRLRFFDAVIGNSDRHEGNWLLLTDGSVVAIDHNRAFDYRPANGSRTCWETEADSLEQPASLGRPLDRLRTLPDDSLAAAVADLEPPRIEEFIAMRTRILDRIDARIGAPDRTRPYDACRDGR